MNLFETLATLIAILLSWWSPAAPPAPAQAEVTAPVVSVIDGDTIIVSIDGREETVRYIGIDTPEPRREGTPECGSHEATEYNKALVTEKSVTLVADVENRDRYDRLLRYVYVDDGTGRLFVNEELVKAGLARTLTIAPNDTYSSDFASLATDAAAAGLGNWSRCE